MGMSLGGLRAVVTADELALHVADARLNGPWWEERGDYHAAQTQRAVIAAAGGDAGDLADNRIGWGDDDGLVLVSPAVGLQLLRGLTE